ncbi:MAG: BTAD domain-containing putative transcriptional regulator, partial [Candidatus Sericytochromatia bacterium]|nr:BTAD domain-containing putative transcriptional regulator [Candidatus Sericytochromatia bacterium]
AEPIESSVRVDDRVGYAVNRGNLAFLQGREDEAVTHVHRALAFPHLGRPRVALTRAEAALNLALLHHERGAYGQARRTLDRLLGDVLALELDPSLERRAVSHRVLLHLEQGDFGDGVRALARTQALPLPANGYHQAACLRLEGSALLRLRRLDEAHRILCRTLDLLHGHGLEAGTESASTLIMLAEVARRRGSLDEAGVLIDRARPITGGFPRISAMLHQHLGMLAWQSGHPEVATAAFREALACLEPVVARPQRAWLTLALACLEPRPEVRGPLRAEAHRLLQEGPYPFLPLSIREFAPAMLTCLAEEQESPLVADIGSRFPKAWEAILSEAHPAARVEIRTFGRLVVTVAGKAAAFPRRKARVLLALLLERPSGLSRDEAADVLFPDLDWDEARHQVDNLTSVLRRALNPGGARDAAPLLLREGGRYRLSREGVWLDLDAFHKARVAGDAAWQSGQQADAAVHYAAALDLTPGGWLAEPDMQEWFEAARTALAAQIMVMRERLAFCALEQGTWEQAREQAEGMLREDPAHEGAHRVLMRLYAALGEASLVQRQFEACAQVLRSELDVTPSPETVALREALRRQDQSRA